MNHYQTPDKEFQFTNSDGIVTPLSANLDDNMVISANHVSTFNQDNNLVDIFPLTPVVPFSADTLPTSGEFKTHLNIQDLITLIEVHEIKAIGVFHEDLVDIFIPTDIDIDDARSLFIVNDDKEQDVSEMLETLKKANTLDNVEDRFKHDDSRSADEKDALNDWVEFLQNDHSYSIYTFTSFEINTENQSLTLNINDKHKI